MMPTLFPEMHKISIFKLLLMITRGLSGYDRFGRQFRRGQRFVAH